MNLRPLTATRHLPLCRISLALAAPDRLLLTEALAEALANEKTPLEEVEESLLQSIPFSGFPAAVEGFSLLRELAQEPATTRAAPTEDGEVFDRIYGADADRVSATLARGHLTLERWVRDFAYSTVMASSPLAVATLEALAVASLIGQRRQLPLHSHLRGALRSGWGKQELSRLIDGLADVADGDIIATAHTLLEGEESR